MFAILGQNWALQKQDVKRLLTCETKRYCPIPNTSWQQNVSNDLNRQKSKHNKDHNWKEFDNV
jgi:hypothetical protein